jgi:hypothetical protein
VATVDAQEAIKSRIERGVSLLIILISADYMNISPLVKHIFHLNSETQLTFFKVIIVKDCLYH